MRIFTISCKVGELMEKLRFQVLIGRLVTHFKAHDVSILIFRTICF